MSRAVEILMGFLNPVVIVFASIGGIISFLIGALANPAGLANSIICGAIDIVVGLLPSTPSGLTIGGIINSASASMPAVGRGIIAEIFTTISLMVGLAIIVKIYKLIPFKMS